LAGVNDNRGRRRKTFSSGTGWRCFGFWNATYQPTGEWQEAYSETEILSIGETLRELTGKNHLISGKATVELTRARGPLAGHWLNPRDGEAGPPFGVEPGATREVAPPDADVRVLHIKKEPMATVIGAITG
jgi:hypothetical protein